MCQRGTFYSNLLMYDIRKSGDTGITVRSQVCYLVSQGWDCRTLQLFHERATVTWVKPLMALFIKTFKPHGTGASNYILFGEPFLGYLNKKHKRSKKDCENYCAATERALTVLKLCMYKNTSNLLTYCMQKCASWFTMRVYNEDAK